MSQKAAEKSSAIENVITVESSNERQVIDFRPLGFRDVVVLGRNEYAHAHPPRDWHRHNGMIEICLLEKGRQVYVVRGEEHMLEGGDVFIVYPDEVHGSGAYPEKGVLYWMLLRLPPKSSTLLSLPAAEWKLMLEPLLQLRPRKFKSVPQLKQSLDKIISIYQDESDPLRIINIKNLMLRFLLDTLNCAKNPSERSISEPIYGVLTYIDKHIENEGLQLDSLASLIGLSLSRFKARFKKEVGTPPAEYLMRRKVDRATQLLLSNNLSVTEISTKLGFSSSQYFATVYKRFTGQIPSDVRRAAKDPLSDNILLN